MSIQLPLIDTVNNDLVTWFANGEKADEAVLNRPSKDLAAVLNTIIGHINDGTIGGSGQMLGDVLTPVKAISYNAQTIAENLTVTTGLNAYTVGDITINDGFAVTIENGALWKIL